MQDKKHKELRIALYKFRELFKKGRLKANDISLSLEYLQKTANKTEWNNQEAYRIYHIIKPYTRQLKMYIHYDFSEVEEPTLVNSQRYTNRNISIEKGKFVVKFPYNDGLVQKIKQIQGRRYVNKIWIIPLTESSKLKEFAMGYNFNISDEVDAIFREKESNYEDSYNSEAVELNLPLKLPLYPFQSSGINYAAKNKDVIIADEMGLGKSIQGIGTVMATDTFPVLCIVPKSLRYNWENEWHKWTDKKVVVAEPKTMKHLEFYINAGVYKVVIVNYEGIAKYFTEGYEERMLSNEGEIIKGKYCEYIGEHYIELKSSLLIVKEDLGFNKCLVFQKKDKTKKEYLVEKTDLERRVIEKIPIFNNRYKLFKSIILDEGHEIRNKATYRYSTIKKMFEEKQSRIILTGTPVVNSPSDLSALLTLIGKIEQFGGHWKFMREYGDLRAGGLNSESKIDSKKLEELNIKLRSTCFIRREKKQVLKDLPDKIIQSIEVEISNRKEYEIAENSLRQYLLMNNASESKISAAERAEILVQINILKQISARGKIESLKEMVKDVTLTGEKIIIFTWFLETSRAIKKAFPKAVTITGDDSDRDIEANKEKFQNDPETQIIIVSYKRGGVGHNLTAASKVLLYEFGWTYKDESQASDRAHRIGQKNVVHVIKMIGKNTIDVNINKIIDGKKELSEKTQGDGEFKELIKQIQNDTKTTS